MTFGSIGLVEARGPLSVIDDSNYQNYVREIRDPSTPFEGGFEKDQVVEGFGSPFSRGIIPRSEWDDHIRRQEAHRSSPDHWRIAGGVPIMDQGNWGYCWMYGLAGAVNTTYAMQGLTGLRLNPFMTAFLGKGGANKGGWAGEAEGYWNKWGCPEEHVWPPNVKNDSLLKSHEVELSAHMHLDIETEELPSKNFDALMSALLDPERPRPVTIGLEWWGHLIYAVKAIKIDSRTYGVKFVNSWTENYGQQGCGALAESKAQAFEQRVISNVRPRVAVDTMRQIHSQVAV